MKTKTKTDKSRLAWNIGAALLITVTALVGLWLVRGGAAEGSRRCLTTYEHECPPPTTQPPPSTTTTGSTTTTTEEPPDDTSTVPEASVIPPLVVERVPVEEVAPRFAG